MALSDLVTLANNGMAAFQLGRDSATVLIPGAYCDKKSGNGHPLNCGNMNAAKEIASIGKDGGMVVDADGLASEATAVFGILSDGSIGFALAGINSGIVPEIQPLIISAESPPISPSEFNGIIPLQLGDETLSLDVSQVNSFGVSNYDDGVSRITSDGSIWLGVSREPNVSWDNLLDIKLAIGLPWGWRLWVPTSIDSYEVEPHSTGSAHSTGISGSERWFEGFSGSRGSNPSVFNLRGIKSFRFTNSSTDGGGNVAIVNSIQLL